MPWVEHREPEHKGTYYYDPDPEETAAETAEALTDGHPGMTDAEREVAAMPGKTIVIEPDTPDTPAEDAAEPPQPPAQTTRRRRRGARR